MSIWQELKNLNLQEKVKQGVRKAFEQYLKYELSSYLREIDPSGIVPKTECVTYGGLQVLQEFNPPVRLKIQSGEEILVYNPVTVVGIYPTCNQIAVYRYSASQNRFLVQIADLNHFMQFRGIELPATQESSTDVSELKVDDRFILEIGGKQVLCQITKIDGETVCYKRPSTTRNGVIREGYINAEKAIELVRSFKKITQEAEERRRIQEITEIERQEQGQREEDLRRYKIFRELVESRKTEPRSEIIVETGRLFGFVEAPKVWGRDGNIVVSAHRGERPYQEDRVIVAEMEMNGEVRVRLLCVIDGMGGHGNGDKAAEIFAKKLQQQFNCIEEIPEDSETIKQIVSYAAEQAQTEIGDTYGEDPGCVFSGAFVVDNIAYIFNVGDSATAFIGSDRNVRGFITTCHSKRKRKEDETLTEPRVTNYVGGGYYPDSNLIDVTRIELDDEDCLVIMTDGFLDNLGQRTYFEHESIARTSDLPYAAQLDKERQQQALKELRKILERSSRDPLNSAEGLIRKIFLRKWLKGGHKDDNRAVVVYRHISTRFQS